MINQWRYEAIPSFVSQLWKRRECLNIVEKYERIVVCGMWWSTVWVWWVQDVLAWYWYTAWIETWRWYWVPQIWTTKTLFVLCSYSWNSEEVIDTYEMLLRQHQDCVVIAWWWKLITLSNIHSHSSYMIPWWTPSRLSTWYFISAFLTILLSVWRIDERVQDWLGAVCVDCQSLSQRSKSRIALQWVNFFPIIYVDQSLWSIGRMCTIKRNENAQVPAFSNIIPEMCHNEFTWRTAKMAHPTIIFINAIWGHFRNHHRIQVMRKLLDDLWYSISILTLNSQGFLNQTIELLIYTEYLTYWYAESRWIDPEVVPLIAKFKDSLREQRIHKT